jgi:CheY-like chemotaxis protein
MKKVNMVCIIDDDPIFIFGTKKIMQKSHFCENFMEFHNGKAAYDQLKIDIVTNSTLPDLILLDLNMPIWDGWQFLDEFVKIPNDKPITIYIITSSVDPADTLKAQSYDQVSNYIVKPITVDELEKIITT